MSTSKLNLKQLRASAERRMMDGSMSMNPETTLALLDVIEQMRVALGRIGSLEQHAFHALETLAAITSKIEFVE